MQSRAQLPGFEGTVLMTLLTVRNSGEEWKTKSSEINTLR